MPRKRAFGTYSSGLSAVEFALVAPVLVLLVFGLAELGRYGIFRLQLSETVSSTADLISRLDPSETDRIDLALELALPGLASFHEDGEIRAIASKLEWDGSDTRIEWRRSVGDHPDSGRIGAVGESSSIAPGLTDAESPSLIAVEIIVTYATWFSATFTSHDVDEFAVVRPRFAAD